MVRSLRRGTPATERRRRAPCGLLPPALAAATTPCFSASHVASPLPPARDLCRIAGLLTDVPDESDDLLVDHSQLTPACLEDGEWPSAAAWDLSDHGIVTSRFVRRLPADP